jgi:hypothetical protein
MQAEGHKIGRIGDPDHPEYPAFLVQFIIIERVSRGHLFGQREAPNPGVQSQSRLSRLGGDCHETIISTRSLCRRGTTIADQLLVLRCDPA